MEYLHTMIRVTDLDASLAFFVGAMGLVGCGGRATEQGRYTLVFLAAPDDVEHAEKSQTPWSNSPTTGARRFTRVDANLRPSRLDRVDEHSRFCERMMKTGVTINRPPRDGRTAFIRSPDHYLYFRQVFRNMVNAAIL